MYRNSKVAVIIAAAGQGKRLGAPVPKQYLKIGGEYVIAKTIKAFEDIDEVDYIFVVTNDEYRKVCADIVEAKGFGKVEGIIAGGSRRQDSVFNALQEINARKPGVSMVLIHDGARPFIGRDVILNVLEETERNGAAVACVAMKNSVRRMEQGGSTSVSVDRADYYSVQTPQGFRKSMLIEAYDKAYDESFIGTDDASIVEWAGYDISIVDGDYGNIKITTREDLPMENRVGTGFDVHPFAEERKLILGGVDIPYDRGLLGHSDADVLVHAVMDALLGAAALGDIGKHFPDSEEEYKDADSLVLLAKVRKMLEENFYNIGNIDVTLIAEKPKISPYIDEMRSNIATTLEIDRSRVNIKGTTTEKLGFTGREEGVACEAVCSIYR
ncbi:MAG: 2-C-methyl-D-erythritol 2,4-cyclodiphosphate synthase [Clostridiales bacterium]|nr:2-C-methyl-D-erythritol 2,4-cyclodiphosphate synthase [Clostridiales bacterium]